MNQRTTDILCLLVGVVSTIMMLIWHVIGAVEGFGLNSTFYINVVILTFAWTALGIKWRDQKLRLLPGIENSTLKSLRIVACVASVVWLASFVLLPGPSLVCFVAAVIIIAALRELGSRQATKVS